MCPSEGGGGVLNRVLCGKLRQKVKTLSYTALDQKGNPYTGNKKDCTPFLQYMIHFITIKKDKKSVLVNNLATYLSPPQRRLWDVGGGRRREATYTNSTLE